MKRPPSSGRSRRTWRQDGSNVTRLRTLDGDDEESIAAAAKAHTAGVGFDTVKHVIGDQGRPAHTIGIMEFRDQGVHEPQHFADPFEVSWPARRVQR